MDAVVVIEFGMERHTQLLAVLHGYDVPFAGCQDVASLTCFRDERSANERHRDVVHFAKWPIGMKAAQLATVGVAAHGDGHGAKPLNL